MLSYEPDIVNYQWGSGAVLNNTSNFLYGVDTFSDGISFSNFSSYLFYSSPEFGVYLQRPDNEF